MFEVANAWQEGILECISTLCFVGALQLIQLYCSWFPSILVVPNLKNHENLTSTEQWHQPPLLHGKKGWCHTEEEQLDCQKNSLWDWIVRCTSDLEISLVLDGPWTRSWSSTSAMSIHQTEWHFSTPSWSPAVTQLNKQHQLSTTTLFVIGFSSSFLFLPSINPRNSTRFFKDDELSISYWTVPHGNNVNPLCYYMPSVVSFFEGCCSFAACCSIGKFPISKWSILLILFCDSVCFSFLYRTCGFFRRRRCWLKFKNFGRNISWSGWQFSPSHCLQVGVVSVFKPFLLLCYSLECGSDFVTR